MKHEFETSTAPLESFSIPILRDLEIHFVCFFIGVSFRVLDRYSEKLAPRLFKEKRFKTFEVLVLRPVIRVSMAAAAVVGMRTQSGGHLKNKKKAIQKRFGAAFNSPLFFFCWFHYFYWSAQFERGRATCHRQHDQNWWQSACVCGLSPTQQTAWFFKSASSVDLYLLLNNNSAPSLKKSFKSPCG